MENSHKNLEWIRKGNTGCTFATLFAKNPECVGWYTYSVKEYIQMYNKNSFPNYALIISIVFDEPFMKWNKDTVKWWSLLNGFYEEQTSEDTTGLRIQTPQGVSWVQYFGPDSHVKTRRAPIPMLMYTRKLNVQHYAKVGWKGILYLAHAWCEEIKEGIYDKLWNRSYKQTEKLLGFRPSVREAARTTFKNNNNHEQK